MAQAGLDAGKHVTWMPAYGAEVRGGTAYSMTKISDEEIASPVMGKLDILVAMNKPSMIKYEQNIRAKGMIVVNGSLIDEKPKRKDLEVLSLPLTEIASKIGDTRCANMVAVGAIIKKTGVISMKAALQALEEMLANKPDMLAINKEAIEKGYKLTK
jgi:2-oxoglutarate ferredoxin oxidoreductase subunit gamma